MPRPAAERVGAAADHSQTPPEVPMKHLADRFRRAIAMRPRDHAPTHPEAAFDRLVALYTEVSTLRDCALVETRVGEDALSYGDALRANQHFSYSRHYRLRAEQAEASIHGELERLRRARLDWQRLSASALTRARQRLYGSSELSSRPQFD